MKYSIMLRNSHHLQIELEVPECLMCNKKNILPSSDGPLICDLCDLGIYEDGTKWEFYEYKKRRLNMKNRIEDFINRKNKE